MPAKLVDVYWELRQVVRKARLVLAGSRRRPAGITAGCGARHANEQRFRSSTKIKLQKPASHALELCCVCALPVAIQPVLLGVQLLEELLALLLGGHSRNRLAALHLHRRNGSAMEWQQGAD